MIQKRVRFIEYYRIVLRTLGLLTPPDNLPQKLAEAVVSRVNFEPFPETESLLRNLQERDLALGIVSNAWPSLDRKYRELGFRYYFQAFVISSQIGCCKPDERIFLEAIQQIDLTATDLVLGIKGVLMDHKRDWSEVSDIARIENLMGLVELLDRM